jgi:hypothetical protein
MNVIAGNFGRELLGGELLLTGLINHTDKCIHQNLTPLQTAK